MKSPKQNELDRGYKMIMLSSAAVVALTILVSKRCALLIKSKPLEGEALVFIPVTLAVICAQRLKSWRREHGITHEEFMLHFATQKLSRLFGWVIIIASICILAQLIGSRL